MKKILVTAGDSWTGGHQMPVGLNGKVWPNMLAKKLGWDFLNVGRGGAGNEYIYNSMVDALSRKNNKVDLAICLWSNADRWDFEGETSFQVNPDNQHQFGVYTKEETRKRRLEVMDIIFKHNLASGKYNILKTLRWQNAFQNYCQCNNIPFIQGTAFYPSQQLDKVHGNIVQIYLEHSLFDSILEKHFWGWPMYEELGGKTMSTMLNKIDPGETKLRISTIDKHPNDKGHKLMAEALYDKYEEIYL